VARPTLPEKALPRLRSGQTLRLRYDAYPYQRYGSVPATLEWLSPAAISGANGATFQARCKFQPAQTSGWIQPRVGMRGEARILVGRRTVLQRALEPLRMLRERLTVG
jgi:multidrug efflux pump subunit AcrA (membrane-fusion protein)